MRRFALREVPVACIVLLVAANPGEARTGWLPGVTAHPRSLADPLEARIGLTYAPGPDHIDASLGAPIPLLEVVTARRRILFVLEGGAFFRLARDGSFFPLETFDGRFGLGVETAMGKLLGRFRIMHWSAHKADGDTSVTFRGQTFSQEFLELEAAYPGKVGTVYARIGIPWHAVPRDRGPRVAAGGIWNLPGVPSSFLSIHLSADRERKWRLDQSLLWGWKLGPEDKACLSLRGYRGNSPRGQYWEHSENYLGLDIQFIP